MNPRTILAEVRRRPLLVIGGLVALFAIANLGDLFGRGGAADEGEPVAPPDPATDPGVADATINADDGYTAPSYGYPSYDPFAYDPGTNEPIVELSPEGCRLPRPETPALYAGQGEYKCDAASKSWVWAWDPAKVSPKGCLLPKPATPAAYTGRGEYVCDAATKQWVWKWKETTPPPPPSKAGRLVLTQGKEWTYAVAAKKASNRANWNHPAITVETGARVTGVLMPDGGRESLVKMTSGPKAGRWIRPTAGTWTAPTGG